MRRQVAAWIASHGVAFIQPPYYLAKGPPRIQPPGGGAAIFSRFGEGGQGGRRVLPL